MSADIIDYPGITIQSLNAPDVLREIADENPKHAFVIMWPKDGRCPTFHSSTEDMPVILYQIERFKHFIFSGGFDLDMEAEEDDEGKSPTEGAVVHLDAMRGGGKGDEE
jgi:hypothetical protein